VNGSRCATRSSSKSATITSARDGFVMARVSCAFGPTRPLRSARSNRCGTSPRGRCCLARGYLAP